jgi:hypothetical protein
MWVIMIARVRTNIKLSLVVHNVCTVSIHAGGGWTKYDSIHAAGMRTETNLLLLLTTEPGTSERVSIGVVWCGRTK